MAAITLQPPGTEYGPCAERCAHKDCDRTRADAARLCCYCGEPLGYGRAVYAQVTEPAHEVCLISAIDKDNHWR